MVGRKGADFHISELLSLQILLKSHLGTKLCFKFTMSVAKQWRKDEGEGECLTLGLGEWKEDKVGLLHSCIYKNFQVLCFYCLSSKLP